MLDSIKFYQTGSNTIGNRLLNPSMRAEQAAVDRPNTLISGHRACQGCGEALGARYAVLKFSPLRIRNQHGDFLGSIHYSETRLPSQAVSQQLPKYVRQNTETVLFHAL